MLNSLTRPIKRLIGKAIDFFKLIGSMGYRIKHCWWCSERFTCVFYLVPVSNTSLEYERHGHEFLTMRTNRYNKPAPRCVSSLDDQFVESCLDDPSNNNITRGKHCLLLIFDFLNFTTGMFSRRVRRGIRIPWEKLKHYRKISDIELPIHFDSRIRNELNRPGVCSYDYVCSKDCFYSAMMYSYNVLYGYKLICKFNKLDSKLNQV